LKAILLAAAIALAAAPAWAKPAPAPREPTVAELKARNAQLAQQLQRALATIGALEQQRDDQNNVEVQRRADALLAAAHAPAPASTPAPQESK
jgi:hypothetical protein